MRERRLGKQKIFKGMPETERASMRWHDGMPLDYQEDIRDGFPTRKASKPPNKLSEK